MINAIINASLVWWLKTARYRWSKLRRNLFERHYLKVSLPSANSLEDIETFLQKITWTMDGPLHLFDSISYPQTTWDRKKDDCDGFAVLAAELILRWQPAFHPVLLTVMLRPVRASHTVCVFSDASASLRVFDNGKLHESEYSDYPEVVAAIQRQACLVCWDTADPENLDIIDFHKPR